MAAREPAPTIGHRAHSRRAGNPRLSRSPSPWTVLGYSGTLWLHSESVLSNKDQLMTTFGECRHLLFVSKPGLHSSSRIAKAQQEEMVDERGPD